MADERSALWTPSRCQFSRAEIVQLMRELSSVFDTVRLVDPGTGEQWMLDGDANLQLQKGCSQCWEVWNKDARCARCISNRAVAKRMRVTKFEFAGDDLYHVTAKYVEVDGRPCSLEMVCFVPEETILEGYGRRDVIEAITKHNRRLYTDPLTGAYNRRYLEDLFQGPGTGRAVAMIDADDFKHVNDTYGHGAGDQVLRGVVEAVQGCVRSADAVIRFGGDEFVVLFDGMSAEKLPEKLEQIRLRVREAAFADAPGYRQTVSIGAVFGDGGLNELIGRADRMLYQAKEAGRDCVRVE